MSIPSTLISCFIGLVSCGDMVLSDSEIIVAHRSRSAQGRVHFITTLLSWEAQYTIDRDKLKFAKLATSSPSTGVSPSRMHGSNSNMSTRQSKLDRTLVENVYHALGRFSQRKLT